MVGLQVAPDSKHAVICRDYQKGKYYFLNNKWAESAEPDSFILTEKDLTERLDELVMTIQLEKAEKQEVTDLQADRRHRSLEFFARYQKELTDYIAVPRSVSELRQQLNPLFRPLLLDGIGMAALAGHEELAKKLTKLQRSLLNMLRGDEKEKHLLSEKMDELTALLSEYQAMIAG